MFTLLTSVILHRRGQALIEFTISQFVIIKLIIVGFALIYIGFIKYFNHINLYNSALCVATQRPIILCKKNLKTKIHSVLFFGEIKGLNLSRVKQNITAYIKWHIGPWEFKKKIILNRLSLAKNLPKIKD